MTAAGPPAPRAGWPDALARGFVVFLAMVAIGQALAAAAWFATGRGVAFGTFARIGAIYVGLFHHVAVRLTISDPEVASRAAASGWTSVSIGVALLSITLVGIVLSFRAGRLVAARAGGRPILRMVRGAAIAPSYAIPVFVLAVAVRIGTPLQLGGFAAGDLRVSLTPWQALVFPLCIAAVAGGVGGMASGFDGRATAGDRLRRLLAASAGAWRMLLVGIALSWAGLFLAGILQPDEPVALLTPTTARYVHIVFDRPMVGILVLGHHLAVLPNEAMWALVPAMGACDAVRGSADADLLCLTRFPTEVSIAVPSGDGGSGPVPVVMLGPAPPGYLTFLLVPAIATLSGGRRAARFVGSRRERLLLGAFAGGLFSILVGVTALLSTITVGHVTRADGSSGFAIVGPDVLAGTLFALAWGVAGGVLGAATAGRSLRSRTGSRTRGRQAR